MPASTIRRPSVPPASTSNGAPAARPIGARSCPRCVLQRSATVAADGSGSSSRSSSDTEAGIAPANSGAPASVTGARRRASSSAASGAIASAVTSSRCVPPRTSVSFSRATDGSSSTTQVHEPGSSRTPCPSQITPPPAATAPDSRPGSSRRSPSTTTRARRPFSATSSSRSRARAAPSTRLPARACGSHLSQSQSPPWARAAAISTSAGLWSVAACATSQRARPATSAGVPANPRTLPPSGTVTGIAVSIAPSSSSRIACSRSSVSPPRGSSTRTFDGRSAVPTRSSSASSSPGRRSHSSGSNGRRGDGASRRRAPSRWRTTSSAARASQAGHGDIQIAPEIRHRGLVAVAGGAPALEVRVDDHRRRQQREREEQEVPGDRRHGATEGERDQRGLER